jgi:hypothetical protein
MPLCSIRVWLSTGNPKLVVRGFGVVVGFPVMPAEAVEVIIDVSEVVIKDEIVVIADAGAVAGTVAVDDWAADAETEVEKVVIGMAEDVVVEEKVVGLCVNVYDALGVEGVTGIALELFPDVLATAEMVGVDGVVSAGVIVVPVALEVVAVAVDGI